MTSHEKHMEFHRRNDETMKRLLAILPACIPRGWRRALLELEATRSLLTGRLAVRHRLTNPETQESMADFPEALFETTTALHQVFAEYQQGWKRASFTLTLDGQSHPQGYNANYTYGP